MTHRASTGFRLGRPLVASALKLLLAGLCAMAAALVIVALQGCTTTRLPDGTTTRSVLASQTVTPGRIESRPDRAIEALEKSPDKAFDLWQRSGGAQQLEK